VQVLVQRGKREIGAASADLHLRLQLPGQRVGLRDGCRRHLVALIAGALPTRDVAFPHGGVLARALLEVGHTADAGTADKLFPLHESRSQSC